MAQAIVWATGAAIVAALAVALVSDLVIYLRGGETVSAYWRAHPGAFFSAVALNLLFVGALCWHLFGLRLWR